MSVSSRPYPRSRRPQTAIAFLALLAGLTLAGLGSVWSWTSPVGSSADDTFHLASIWCAWGESDTCVTSKADSSYSVPQTVVESDCYRGKNYESARCTWLTTNELVDATFLNPSSGGYPPLFYSTMRLFVGENVERSTLLMRMFNSFIAGTALCLALIVSLARVRKAVALSWLVGIFPIGIFFIASTNPSSWAIIGVGLFWAFLLSTFQLAKQRGWRFWVAASASAIMAVLALGARSDSVYLIALSVIACGILHFGTQVKARYLLGLATLVACLAVFAALFRVGRYLQEYSLSFPSGNAMADQPNPVVKTLLELPSFLVALVGGQSPDWIQREGQADWGLPGYSWTGFQYGAGWLDVTFPSVTGVLLSFSVAGLIFLGLAGTTRRLNVVLLILFLAFVLQVLVMRSLTDFAINWGLQPRYFIPFLLVILGFACLGLSRNVGASAPNGVQSSLLGVTVIVAASSAQLAAMSRYVNGQNHSWLSFDVDQGWWWSWGPSPIALALSGGVLIALYVLVLLTIARVSDLASDEGVPVQSSL